MASETSRREIDVSARHGRLHCLIQGKGDPLVLLHGALGTGQAHFREQIGEFALSYQVIVPDLLGYGQSGRRASFDPGFHHQDAEDVAALIQHLDLLPVHLCGFSDGAIVAIILAGAYSPLIRSLILIGGQTLLDDQSMDIIRQWAPPDRLPVGFQQALARSHGDPYWRQLVTDYVRAFDLLFSQTGDIAGEYLPRITCPTLIIQGKDDPWVNPVHAHMLHRSIQGSELELFPGAGHEVQRDQPEAFNRRVLRFLSSLRH